MGFSVKDVYLDGFLACALLDFVYKSLHWTPGVGVSCLLGFMAESTEWSTEVIVEFNHENCYYLVSL